MGVADRALSVEEYGSRPTYGAEEKGTRIAGTTIDLQT
jgi:hypothetical protein